MQSMSREQCHFFLKDLLENVVPNGLVDRVAEFYTSDMVGHFRGEEFYFGDIKERVGLLGKYIDKHHIEIIDFVQFDNFIHVVSRQNWRNISDNSYLEILMSVIYRMRDNKICELWLITDVDLDPFVEVNQHFLESMRPLVINEKDKAIFMKRLEASQFFYHGQQIALSPRERETLYYYLNGFSAKEIAKVMGLSSYRTIEDYLANIKVKFGCTTKSELRQKLFPIKK